MIETQGDASNVTYILKGASNTNRYLLVSEGFDENSKPSWDAYFTSLNFNGVPMQKIVSIGFPPEVDANESHMIMWGIAIPNDWVPSTMMFQGARQYSGGGSRTIPLYVREFSHVNQTNPVYASSGLRKGASLTTWDIILEVPYVKNGGVADSVFLSNVDSEIPKRGFSIQTVDSAILQRASSHFIASESGEVAKFGWDWYYGDRQGSDASMAMVSLAPD